MSLPLVALFIAAFAFGTTEFVIAGVLPEVAAGLGVSIPAAGYLVSGYAIGIAVGGPLLTLATNRFRRKTLLLALTLAVGLVHEDRRGMAVALILAGLTVSGVVGVPIGTAIGNAWGWRWTFWAMFGLGLVAIAAIALMLPQRTGAARISVSFGSEVRVLGRQQVWTSLILMLMLMLGQFVPYTYIAPLLQQVTGLDASLVPWVLLLNGIGATIGVFVGGKLSAGRLLMPSLISMLALQGAVLVTVYLFSPYPLPMIAALTAWGALNFAIGTPIQTRILSWTADAPNLASSLIPSGFNIGIAVAASFGSMLLASGYSYRALPLVGVAAMTVATAVALGSYLRELRSGAAMPLAASAQAPQ